MNLSRLILLGRQVQPGDQGTMVDNVFLSLNKAFEQCYPSWGCVVGWLCQVGKQRGKALVG